MPERGRAGARLTQGGQIFLQFAEQSTAALRQGLRSLRTGRAAGRLRVGVLPSVAAALLPEAALRFADEHPETLLELHEGPHHDLTARRRRGRLDLVVGRLGSPDAMQGLAFRQLYSEAAVAVAAPASPGAEVTRFADLDRFRVPYPPMEAAIRPLVARMLIAAGVPLFPRRIETASVAFGRAAVLADPDRVWIISCGVVRRDLEAGRLVALEFDMAATPRGGGRREPRRRDHLARRARLRVCPSPGRRDMRRPAEDRRRGISLGASLVRRAGFALRRCPRSSATP